MNSLTRRAAQRHRVNRVLNFTYANLGDELGLEELAGVACLSKFHFSRVFSSYLNETPLRFLWRVRVERAAQNLVFFPDETITDVALNTGFSSAQVLSRKFRVRYQVTPRSFRSAKLMAARHRAASRSVETTIQGPRAPAVRFPVRVEQRPSYRVAYVRTIGLASGTVRGAGFAYRALECWARSQGLWGSGSTAIGLCPDHAAFTPPESCIYDACLPVPDIVCEDDIVSIQTIPAGLYAVLKVECAPAQLHSHWDWLTAVWLPESGRTREALPCYEFYPPASGRPLGPENGVELCMRLRDH